MKKILIILVLLLPVILQANQNHSFLNTDTSKTVVDTLNEFDPPFAEYEPTFDMIEFQSRVDYPEMARRNGIEGNVYVIAFIDKNGKILKAKIEKSDSKMLNDAALKAVRGTKFTPAKLNGANIGSWISIPIKFRLTEKKTEPEK